MMKVEDGWKRKQNRRRMRKESLSRMANRNEGVGRNFGGLMVSGS